LGLCVYPVLRSRRLRVPLLQRVTFEKRESNQSAFAPGWALLRRVPALRRRSVGPRRTGIHALTALSRHPCRSTHCASSTFGLHPSRVLWCLDWRGTKSKMMINPTLCVGMPVRTLCVHLDAERQSLCYHAEQNGFWAAAWLQVDDGPVGAVGGYDGRECGVPCTNEGNDPPHSRPS
jgi:hypothetical protein